MQVSPGHALRLAMNDGMIRALGAPNAAAAKLIERSGFEAVYLSGAVLSAGILGVPDIGLFTLTELVQQTTYLTRSVNIPVIVDCDTGFGNALQVERTIMELEAAGAAAIQLEDQQSPKRCGHLNGKTLISADSMCAKIRAAVAARTNNALVIIARTDARGVTSLDDTIARARLYIEAGADWIFPEALQSEAEFAQFAKEIQAPLLANMTEFGKSPLLPAARLQELGYAAVLYPVTLFRVAMNAMETAARVLALQGTQEQLLSIMQTREALYELINYEAFALRDQRYAQPEQPFDRES
jgi:methylisocitrate lyase